MKKNTLNKSLLLLTSEFPPKGGSPVQRVLRITEYLSRQGWNIFISTVSEKSCKKIWRDDFLFSKVPKEAKVNRSVCPRIREKFNKFFPRKKLKRLYEPLDGLLNVPPDDSIDWLPFLYRASKKIIQENKIDAMISTAPLFTVHLAALFLKKRYNIKWIADFRDEWVDNPFRNYHSRWKKNLDEQCEKKVIECADKVVVTTNRYNEFLKEKYPFSNTKIVTISNGYDADDFNSVQNIGKTKEDTVFRIFSAGKFYGLRKADIFLDAVNNLLKKKLIPENKIKIDFAGVYDWALKDYVKGKPVMSVLNCLGFLPHQEIITRYQSASILLLVVNPESKLSIPGKTYEYLASNKPILALIPEDSATYDLLKEFELCTIAASDNIDMMQQSILSLYRKWKLGQLNLKADRHMLYQYESKILGSRLTDILQEWIHSKAIFANTNIIFGK